MYGDSDGRLEMVQFSDLSNADIDLILAVKAEMQASRIQTN